MRLLTLNELALELRVSPKTIYWWTHQKQIPFLKMGRHLRFELEVVLEAFRSKAACAQPISLLERRQSRSLKIQESAVSLSRLAKKGD